MTIKINLIIFLIVTMIMMIGSWLGRQHQRKAQETFDQLRRIAIKGAEYDDAED